MTDDAWTYLTRRSIEALADRESPRAKAARDLIAGLQPTDAPEAMQQAADALRAVLPEINTPSRIAMRATADMIADRARNASLHARLDRLDEMVAEIQRRRLDDSGR